MSRIVKLMSNYFQKSTVMLYPVLAFTNAPQTKPLGTYMAWAGKYEFNDNKLICLFNSDTADLVKLQKHRLHESTTRITPDTVAMVFNMALFKNDLALFREGKYSLLSVQVKVQNKSYYGEFSPEYTYVDSYLYPEMYHSIYAELLDVELKLIRETFELCDKPDLVQETFVFDLSQVKEPAEVGTVSN